MPPVPHYLCGLLETGAALRISPGGGPAVAKDRGAIAAIACAARSPPSAVCPPNRRSRASTGKGRDSGTYRTVCVRLCDGYFWPVSFAASRAALEYDRRKCEQSCESPAKLYAARGVEAPLEDMKDESGRYYGDLKTAFVYRSSYLESCKCRAHPWEAEAQARHAGYASTRPSLRQR